MAIVRLDEFEEDFETEELEILALLKDEPGGGMIYKKDFIRPLVYTYATMDSRTGQLNRQEGILMWLVTNDHSGWGFDFTCYEIYRLRVRKAKVKPLPPYTKNSWNNRYLVLDILESNVKQSELEVIAAYVQQPRTIAARTGEFILNRKYGWYERKTSNLSITLSLDEDSEEKCSNAWKVFEEYEPEIPELDRHLRNCAAEKLLDAANDWREAEEKPPITETEFAEMISLTDLQFHNDGTLDAYYDDCEIFAGHCIVISMDANGTVTDADIAG